MAISTKKGASVKLRSAAFKRVRADHSAELAGDYVEMIADLRVRLISTAKLLTSSDGET